jgi:outer membrane lipoprotein-sorting protein
MIMRKNIWLAIFMVLTAGQLALALTPQDYLDRLDKNFTKLKDAQADISLGVGLQLIGCGGLQQQKGRLYFKAPDRFLIKLERETYFIKGNTIKKIDNAGKRSYVQLLYAPDFSHGYNAGLLAYNFNLKLLKESSTEVQIEGLPKPGVLKNVTRVVCFIDPQENLLTRIDLTLRQHLSGDVLIKYQRLDDINVPVATYGKSALELSEGSLVGLIYDLRGNNLKINQNLPDSLFEADF